MKRTRLPVVLLIVLLSLLVQAQLDKITIAAGTPEDKALQDISNEADAAKKMAMYEDFLRQFSSNPAAIAFGNWQLAQAYEASGDLQKALEYGDKALVGSPHNLDILVTQASVAQQMKDNTRIVDYAVRGGEAYNSIGKQPKPEGLSDEDLASHNESEKAGARNAYEFLEATAFNALASETSAKTRMSEIERFTAAFPHSRFEEQTSSYALVSLSELKDTPGLLAYGEKVLTTNPDSLPTLLMMASAYVDDPKPGSVAKAVTYAQKAITAAKADAPDADRSRKLSAGVAHATLGYAYMKQEKTAAAIPELAAGAALLKGQDQQQYAIAEYRLGYAYAKLSKTTEARAALTEAAAIAGPVQQPAKDLLVKVNAARAKGK